MAQKTGQTTVFGKPVYEDEEGIYSERSYTVPMGDGYTIIPSVIDNGMEMSYEETAKWAMENGPFDFMSGEKFPVFETEAQANRYAEWRSENMFNEDVLSEDYWHRDAGMPFYSEESLDEYRPTLRDNARNNIREKLENLGLSEGVSRDLATGIAGEENPTDGGMGLGLMDLTPAGMLMGGQEARRNYNRAWANEDLGGMAMAGLEGALAVAEGIPLAGVGAKAVGKGIKKAANALTDAYDPNAVGSLGGNLFSKSDDVIAQTDEAFETGDAFETLGVTEADQKVWRAGKEGSKQKQRPEIATAAQRLFDGEITNAEFRQIADSLFPPRMFNTSDFPTLPSLEDVAFGLKSNQVNDAGIVGVNKEFKTGERVASRLDIPAYENFDTWIVSVHEGKNGGGKALGYAQTAHLKAGDSGKIEFKSSVKSALNIAREKPVIDKKTGKSSPQSKSTFARIFGEWQEHNPESLYEQAQSIVADIEAGDSEWIQVGMNPYRASYFYDKATGQPVIEADEVLQVGPLVLVKGAKKTTPDDPMFRVNPKDENSPTFNKGGMVQEEEIMKFGRGGFNSRRGRGRGEDGEDYGDKYESLREAFRKRREAKRDEAVSIDIEQATSQPMSVEEKRAIEGAVESTGDAAKKGGVRNQLFTETDQLINTPEELERRENAPDPKTPKMKTDVEPKTRKLPSMYEDNPSGEAENEDGIVEKPAMSMYHGGLGMSVPSATVGYDPVSGNPIPLGSSAENVRDDIPAALSTGEYVMPADVVRWHGLKHIMDMYAEAKNGLMSMAAIGQIRGIGEEDLVNNGYSEVSGDDEGNERDNDEIVLEEYTDDDGVEYAEVEVVEEEYPLEEEDSIGVEAYPTEEMSGQYTVGDEQVLLIFQTPK